MAHVPSHYIRFKVYDFNAEITACLNQPFYIGDFKSGLFHWLFRDCSKNQLEIYPPSIGVFSLLEVIDSVFVKDGTQADAWDFLRCLFIAYYRKDAASFVREWIQAGGKDKFNKNDKSTWLDWDYRIARFADKIHADKITLSEIADFRSFLLSNTFNGYEMIPDSSRDGESYMPYLFGAETLASVASIAGKLGCTYDQAIWDVPLCLCGFITSCEARKNGIKGVSRGKDLEHMKQMFKEANERELKGELHPWQIEEPENGNYALSDIQRKARPEIVKEYQKLLKEKLRSKRAVKSNG